MMPPFTTFAESVGCLKLTPAQRACDLVAFEGVDPIDLPPELHDYAYQIFGDVDRVPVLARRDIVTKKGRDIGGTMRNAYRVLHLGLIIDLERLAPGEEAFGIIVGPDMRLANQALCFIEGAVDTNPYLARMVVSRTSTSLSLRRPDDHLITFECLPATVGGGALRGRSLFAAMFTEGAFLRDTKFVINDEELYRAVSPRILSGGQVLFESTPYLRGVGLLWKLFTQNWGTPVTCLAANCPTLLMRGDDPGVRENVERERKRDPINAKRENDAEFIDSKTGGFFGPECAGAVLRGLSIIPRLPDAQTLVSADVALSPNGDLFGWAVAGAVWPPWDSTTMSRGPRRTVVYACGAWRADRDPRAMACRLRDEVCSRYGTRRVILDQHEGRSFSVLCRDAGLSPSIVDWVAGEGEASKTQRYRTFRSGLANRDIDLPDVPQLEQDMGACVAEFLPGGGERVHVPRRGGSHGDVLSAVVAAATEVMRASATIPEAQLSWWEHRTRRANARLLAVAFGGGAGNFYGFGKE